MNFIRWTFCLFLRFNIAILSWLHERVENGPPARLWLARDSEILAEVVKRRLLVKKIETVVLAQPKPAPKVEDRDVIDASKAVARLLRISPVSAEQAVASARAENPKAKIQELITTALRYAA